MSEMPHASENHRHPMFIRGFDHFRIPDRSAGLNDGRNTHFGCGIEAITEWKEGVRSHDAAFDRHLRLHGRQLHGIHAAHLPCADADGLARLGIDDGVGLDVFADFPRKGTSGIFFIRRLTDGRHGKRPKIR